MLAFSESGFANNAELIERCAKLEALCADLKRLHGGHLPTIPELQAAPLLHNWRLMLGLRVVMYGHVSDHPILTGSRRRIETSEVVVNAEGLGWMRTASRFYRLGRPAVPGSTFDDDDIGNRGHLRIV